MKMPSRHKNKKLYLIFIVLDSDASGIDRLAEFCCSCLSELGIVNPCGHIITSLAILNIGFFSRTPAPKLANIFAHEAQDESEDEN